MSIREQLAERIAAGLKRKSVTTPSRWAENYRVIKGEPWSFKRFPWLKEMHDSKAQLNVGLKAAQMGYTETVLNITFYKIDVEGVDCLYALPSKVPDATDFSAARFLPALEESEHLRRMFTDTNNIGHKRSGPINLYIRGSQSRSGLKSVPTGFIVLDELAEFNQENIALALERSSGQEKKQFWMISTPTLKEENIDKYFRSTTQESFFFRCPGCSKLERLVFPDSLIITAEDQDDPRIKESHLICTQCKIPLKHENKIEWLSTGRWVPQYPDRDSRGFHISQLYSTTVTPSEIASSYLKGLTDVAEATEFHNSKLGTVYVAEGAQVFEDDIHDCKRGYKNTDPIPRDALLTMGVDVGTFLHFEIDQWHLPNKPINDDTIKEAIPKVVHFGKAKTFAELEQIMRTYFIRSCVIDANPERRKALEFAAQFYGFVKLCFYGRGINGKTINQSKSEPTITVDRTSWMDLALGRFKDASILVPMDVDLEYRSHIQAPVKVYSKDADGNPVGKYEHGSKEDHYAHARTYAEIALTFALSQTKNKNIKKVL